jgi:hypothetical protein
MHFVIPKRRCLPVRNPLLATKADSSRDKTALRNDKRFKLSRYPIFVVVSLKNTSLKRVERR